MTNVDGVPRRRHLLRSVLAAMLLAAVAFAAGVLAGRTTATVPDVCRDALASAERIAVAVEEEWTTASAAVDGVQNALAESGFRRLAMECLE